MAFETIDFTISPNDGWTLVATDPSFLLVRPHTSWPWRVAVTASGAPLVAAESADGTITFTGSGTAGDTVTVGDIVYEAVASDPDGNEFEVGGTAEESRDNLLAAIVANSTSTGITASAVSSDQILLVAPAGSSGNLLTLSETSDDISVGAFSGGSDATGSIVYKPTEDGPNEFRIEGSITGEFYVKADRPRGQQIGNVTFGVIRDQ